MSPSPTPELNEFLSVTTVPSALKKPGFRLGDKGTHTSRTIMLPDIMGVFATVGPEANRSDYERAIITNNCLNKMNPVQTHRRLRELYGLDPRLGMFNLLRQAWKHEEQKDPRVEPEPKRLELLALLVCLARDPLLMATASAVVGLRPDAALDRNQLSEVLHRHVGGRLNPSILAKVVRNAASSWSQSGHLVGKVFKTRHSVSATPATVALALYLGYAAGFRKRQLLTSGWMRVLDCDQVKASIHARFAASIGLVDQEVVGEVFESLIAQERLGQARGNRLGLISI